MIKVLPMAVPRRFGIFDELLDRARLQAPQHMLASIEDVGNVAAFLVSDSARALTGNIEYIDAGYHIMG